MSPYVGLIPFLLSLLLYITLGPLLLLFLLINELVRLLVSIYLKFKYNGDVFLISSGNDAIFSGKTPGKTRMVIAGFKYKGTLEKEAIANVINNKVLNELDAEGNLVNERMKFSIIKKCGYGCWKVNPDFDIDNHIRVLKDKVYSKPDLQNLIMELSKDTNSTHHPQWECVIVPRYKENKDEEESGWGLFRFNHTYMDGLSMTMLMEKYVYLNFTYYINPMKFEIASWKRSLFYLNSIIFAPYALAAELINGFKSHWPALEIPKGRKMQRNFHWTVDLSKERIYKIRKAVDNATLSAVVQNAFISAAVQTLPSRRIPEKWIVADLAAMLPYKESGPQNRFTGFVYPINSMEEDFARIKNTKQAAWDGMIGPHIPLMYFVFMTVGRMPIFIHSWVLLHMSSTFFSSNVPLSKTKINAIGNAEIVEVFGFPPQPTNAGITLCCTTYVNAVKISCSAQSNWIREDELDDIMKKVPKIIENWEMKVKELNLKRN